MRKIESRFDFSSSDRRYTGTTEVKFTSPIQTNLSLIVAVYNKNDFL